MLIEGVEKEFNEEWYYLCDLDKRLLESFEALARTVKRGARQAEPPAPKSHHQVDDDRNCLKASGSIDLDV